MRTAWLSTLVFTACCVSALGAGPKVPIIHSTDLFHPHADPDGARRRGLAGKEIGVFRFVPMRASLDQRDIGPKALHVALNPAKPNGFVFRATHARYEQIMASCLKNLLAELGR